MRQPDSTPTPTETITNGSTLDDLQRRIGTWALRTFPGSNVEMVVTHLGTEVTELRAACTTEDDFAVAEEAADCAILLLNLAHRVGFSLAEVVAAKQAVNESRTWETDAGEKGYRKHTEARP